MNININNLIPNNWYINKEKLDRVLDVYKNSKNLQLPNVLVSKIDNDYSLIDGHSRVYAAYQNGKKEINCDIQNINNIEGSTELYIKIHKISKKIGINHISKLENRIIDFNNHKTLWQNLCSKMLEFINNDIEFDVIRDIKTDKIDDLYIVKKAEKYDAKGIGKVHLDSWKETYKGIMPQEKLDSLDYDNFTKSWISRLNQENSFTFVIEHQSCDSVNEIVGFAIGGKNRDQSYEADCELSAIYFLEKAKRKGFGKVLTKKIVKKFVKNNHKSMVIWCLENNNSCGFYRKIDGKEKYLKQTVIGKESLDTVGFYWADINNIL